jgi:hypothetical protein
MNQVVNDVFKEIIHNLVWRKNPYRKSQDPVKVKESPGKSSVKTPVKKETKLQNKLVP